jgi:aminoglycoside 6'-N-acetyltransferase I
MGLIVAPDGLEVQAQMAELLTAGFGDWGSWQDPAAARAEVELVLGRGFARVDLDGTRVLGWVGGLPEYHGRVWELHPLVVRAEARGRGIGRALVAAFEDEARARGGLTATLGTDDVDAMTSLGGVDLYDDVPGRIAAVRNLRRHPYEFYVKCGYTITGVLPDANGPGKPDLYLSKRLAR